MAKTLVDIDDDLLTQAQQILGTTTKKDTVNGALREVVRRRAAQQFIALARSGCFTALLQTEPGKQNGKYDGRKGGRAALGPMEPQPQGEGSCP
jgi:Arc/MetJ family transcription regulator